MNYIGLDQKGSEQLSSKLNQLLASYQLHYQNLRGLHWNIQGENFFELHLKYEELYTRTQIIIDDIAERILTLGKHPLHTFTDYLSHSTIKELPSTSNGNKGMEYLLESQKDLLVLERSILDLAGKIGDEGTNSLMSDLIREKEKNSWMFRSWLSK
jgi:starvation-inducible DNA-binding protein